MNMKKTNLLFILFTVLMSMVSNKAFAYDISVANADGVVIYYNYVNDYTELEVTSSGYTNTYCGDVVISETIDYENITCK